MNTKNNLSFFECSTCAFRHFASAKLLSNEKYYDMAIGHLILGAEESIKALVYYSRTVDFLNIVELPGIFKDHSIKHKALAEIHTSWIELLEIFLKSINVFKDERNLLFEHISNNSNNDEAEIK